MPMVIALIGFWLLFFAVIAINNPAFRTGDLVQKRVDRLLSGHTAVDPEILIDTENSPNMRRLRAKLHILGLNRKSDLKKAVFFRRICYLMPFLSMGVLFFMGFPMVQVLAGGVCFGIIFILIPKIWLLRAYLKRKKELTRNLPDTLDLLTLCLEAGLSFDSALVRVAEEQQRVSPHISRELRLTNQEILAGRSRKAALKNLADRTDVDEIRALTGAIQQSMKLGTSLVKTLRTQAEVTRKKKREQIRAAILKTPVKLIFPLIFLIFPTLMIVILAPSLVNTFRHLAMVQH